jgi:preprotein translocase SecE subunit
MTLTNNGIVNYFKTTYQELSRVVWPSRQQTTNHSLIVIAASIVTAIFFGLVDFILSLGLEQLITRF